MNNNNNARYDLTPEMKNQIKELAKQKHYSQGQAARIIGISLSKYKNIVRTIGNQSIDRETLIAILKPYGITIDYFLGLSENPDEFADGRLLTQVINFKDRKQMIAELSDFLNKTNNTFLPALHFLLIKMPLSFRNGLMKSIIGIYDLIKNFTFYAREDCLTLDTFEEMQKNFLPDDPFIIKSIVLLSEADKHCSSKRFMQALRIYLDIILHPLESNAKYIDMAKKRIFDLSKEWSYFSIRIEELSSEQKECINGILNDPYVNYSFRK